MSCNSILRQLNRRGSSVLAATMLVCCGLIRSFAANPDQPTSDAVGVIEGEAIAVSGPMSVEATRGQVKTMLRSGSDVRVKSGTARIDLVEGGQISICGPAHLSLLKQGGSLTVALEAGTIRAHIEQEPALTIYTAQIQAKTIAIGDGPQDVSVGLESPGVMCLRANRGAIRLEQQLTGQTLMVPQAGEVQILNGQMESLRNEAGHCRCELQEAKAAETGTVRRVAAAEEAPKNGVVATPGSSPAIAEGDPPKEEPVYQVLMPPLVYDAKAKTQTAFDPNMIVLIRRVRVRPSLIFQGRVEGEATVAASVAPPKAPPASAPPVPTKPAAAANDSFVDRIKSLVRKLWSR